MEHVLDYFEFVGSEELVERLKSWLRLQDWLPDPNLSIGPPNVVYIEDGQGDTMKRAVLLEKTLSDGSRVYSVRLS